MQTHNLITFTELPSREARLLSFNEAESASPETPKDRTQTARERIATIPGAEDWNTIEVGIDGIKNRKIGTNTTVLDQWQKAREENVAALIALWDVKSDATMEEKNAANQEWARTWNALKNQSMSAKEIVLKALRHEINTVQWDIHYARAEKLLNKENENTYVTGFKHHSYLQCCENIDEMFRYYDELMRIKKEVEIEKNKAKEKPVLAKSENPTSNAREEKNKQAMSQNVVKPFVPEVRVKAPKTEVTQPTKEEVVSFMINPEWKGNAAFTSLAEKFLLKAARETIRNAERRRPLEAIARQREKQLQHLWEKLKTINEVSSKLTSHPATYAMLKDETNVDLSGEWLNTYKDLLREGTAFQALWAEIRDEMGTKQEQVKETLIQEATENVLRSGAGSLIGEGGPRVAGRRPPSREEQARAIALSRESAMYSSILGVDISRTLSADVEGQAMQPIFSVKRQVIEYIRSQVPDPPSKEKDAVFEARYREIFRLSDPTGNMYGLLGTAERLKQRI